MKDKKDFSSKILEFIEKKNIKPKPRWEFLVKNYIILATGIISIIVGGIAIAVIIFMVINNDWDLLPYFNRSPLGHFFVILPYYWLLFLSLFILAAYYNLKHTKKGYRYSLLSVILISVGTSVILGVSFYAIGFGREIDNIFSRRVPIYRDIAHRMPKEFSKPDSGILAGEIKEINSDNSFIILDMKNDTWEIRLNSLKQKCIPNIAPEIKIIVIGEDQGNNIFNAFTLRLWNKEDMFKQIEECGELFYEDMINLKDIIMRNGVRPGMGPGMMQKELMKEVKGNY